MLFRSTPCCELLPGKSTVRSKLLLATFYSISLISASFDHGLQCLVWWVMPWVVGCIWCSGLGCCENGFTEELLLVWVAIVVACGCGYGLCNFG